MLTVAAVAALQCPDALSRAIVLAGCARIWLCPRRDIWCLVDADDYPWLSTHGWNVGGHSAWKHYGKRNEGAARSTVYLHREVLVRHDPREPEFLAAHHAHHLNGQSLDCRGANLGWRTASVNAAIRNARSACPSLESIVAQLARYAAAEAPPF
jgi:hypothetical protein